ncbi:MAG: alpha/beta hydrolase [Chloroflexia bacterium]
MRGLGMFLAERGVTVHAPLLPGMGTVPEALLGVSWEDWVRCAETALAELRNRCRSWFVAGLSLGGLLTLYLAARAPVAGAMALAPAIRVRDWRFRFAHLARHSKMWIEPDPKQDDLADPAGRSLTWHYPRYPASSVSQVLRLVQETRRSLGQIRCPVLIVQSPRDGTLVPEGARWAYERIPADKKRLVWLERSGHNILVDLERERVFEEVWRFLAEIVGIGESG